jgi:hypothetical protein
VDAVAKVKGTLVVTLVKFIRARGLAPEDVFARFRPADAIVSLLVDRTAPRPRVARSKS